MRNFVPRLLTCLLAAWSGGAAADVLLQHVVVYDGTGRPAFQGDVRVHGRHIAAVATHLAPRAGEEIRDLRGLALAPGFIDMHSHGDRGLLADRDAGTIARQGVTTIVVGQDGESNYPLAEWFGRLEATPRRSTSRAWSGTRPCGRRRWARISTGRPRRTSWRR